MNNIINLIVDTFDDAVKTYYDAIINEQTDNTAVTNYDKEKGRENYCTILLKLYQHFLGIKELYIYNEDIKKVASSLDELSLYLESNTVNYQDVKKALLLLDINCFKNLNFSLDLITPDIIGVIINSLIVSEKNELNILDPNIGTGNLLFTIAAISQKTLNLYGMENHYLLSRLVTENANMLNQEISVFNQDALMYNIENIDIVISDLANYNYESEFYQSELMQQGINYFPYLIIEKYLKCDSYRLNYFLVNNEFFSQKGNQEFKKMLEKNGRLLCTVFLPTDLFQTNNIRVLLIIDNEKESSLKTDVVMLPSIKNLDSLKNELIKTRKILQEKTIK